MLKKTVAAITAAVLALAFAGAAYAAGIPGDIAGHWAEDKIKLAISLHMFDEAPELLEKFEPDRKLTRVEVCGVLNRLNRFTEEADTGFTDVNPGSGYDTELRRAVKAGYFFGSGGLANPDGFVTRAEVSSMLYRIGKYPKAAGAGKVFNDYGDIPPWAVEAVDACVKKGLWSGDDRGNIRPGGNITRAELVALAYNLLYAED